MLEVRGVEVGPYKVLRAESSVVPNAIAALLLHLRDTTGKTPHCYFGWTEGNPIVYLFRFLLFGEGLDATGAGHRVGYGDASQFTREYKRLFGAPPMRDAERLREAATTGVVGS